MHTLTLKDNANAPRTTQITVSWGSARLFTRQIHAKCTFRASYGLSRGVNLVLAKKRVFILKTTLKDNVNTLRVSSNLT